MTTEEKTVARYWKIAEQERELLLRSHECGDDRGFVTCTELGHNVNEWLEYKKWLNEIMYPEE